MNFEQHLATSMFQRNEEKTLVDKVLAREDVNRIRDLVKKPNLTRSELLEVLYLLAGTESKLVNYSEYDRYVILKFFVWIREFIKVAELLYDYEDDLLKKNKLTPRGMQLFNNTKSKVEHNAKFLIDLYFNISRTTLSLGATGILELIKNKYEVIYPRESLTTPEAQAAARRV